MLNLSFLQQILTRYGMSTYTILGNIGNLLNMIIFYQFKHRKNPCSIYLLSMTICNLICLNTGTIPIILSLDFPDIRTQYLFICKIQFYIRHTTNQMMRTYKVLACIDRFALSSTHITIRSFSQYNISIRLIIITGIFWLIIGLFFSFIRSIKISLCSIHNDSYFLIYTIYYMISAGILPPILILIFSILLMKNLKEMRAHIHCLRQGRNEKIRPINILRKRDRDLMKMVLVEVMFYVISTLPFSIYLIYRMITNDKMKSEKQNQMELFINYLTQSFMMYLNTVLPFYIYITTSTAFRRQCKKIIIKFYRFIRRNKYKKSYFI
ncbi:unnamed protein product [Adineta steineri]|uniref:G-protein coupled receptors family 1 profile domain-containing protein n=1 Tax=Adineta steineri TaxID=433720 RepID=A0A815CKR5_9BILA|nr:unnamed protein product [Adineta steineri]CAF1566415.1 unnamed protein product [Adineta steineri]